MRPVETATEEAKVSSDPPSSTSAFKKRKRKGERETERKASRADSTYAIKYDETLLAVVGILDEVKFQSNVASWVKANGLWGAQNSVDVDALTHDHFRKGSVNAATSSDSGSVDSGRLGKGKKKRRDSAVAFAEATAMDGTEDGRSLYAPTNEKQRPENSSETPLWFDNSPTMRYWVDRGRKALATLGIPIEHGLEK